MGTESELSPELQAAREEALRKFEDAAKLIYSPSRNRDLDESTRRAGESQYLHLKEECQKLGISGDELRQIEDGVRTGRLV